MRGEECAALDTSGKLFHDSEGDCHTIVGGSTSTELVGDEERSSGCKLQGSKCFFEFQVEGGLAIHQEILGTEPCEDTVNGSKQHGLARH